MVRKMYIFEDCVYSTVLNVNEMAKRTVEKLAIYFNNDELIYNLRLIITELVVNGVEHGNMGDLNKKVYLCVTLKRDKIIVRVRDQGQGVDFELNDTLVNMEKTCGRGLFIVNKLCNNLEINKNEIVAELLI